MRSFAGSGWMGLVVLSISGSAASGARAESIDGRVRLGLEAGLLEHRVETRDVNLGSSFGLPAVEQERTQTAVGFASTPFGPLFGYGVSDSVYIGAQATIANQNESVDGLYSA